MDPAFAPKDDLEATEASCRVATTKATELWEDLCEELERKNPEDLFGKPFFEKIKSLTDQSDALVQNLELEPDERLLFKLLLFTHDIGRPRESYLRLNTLRSEGDHGDIAVSLLNEQRIFEDLREVDRADLLLAVENHCKQTVELEPGTRAYRLCYALRDLDKYEALKDPKFTEALGIYGQLKHYKNTHFDGNEGVIHDTGFRTAAIAILESFLTNGGRVERYGRRNADTLAYEKLSSILEGGISSDVIQTFSDRGSLPKATVGESYAAYMLWMTTWVFDIHSPKILELVLEDKSFHRKLAIALLKASPRDQETILSTLSDFFDEKLTTRSEEPTKDRLRAKAVL